jgi:hypothetical protein
MKEIAKLALSNKEARTNVLMLLILVGVSTLCFTVCCLADGCMERCQGVVYLTNCDSPDPNNPGCQNQICYREIFYGGVPVGICCPGGWSETRCDFGMYFVWTVTSWGGPCRPVTAPGAVCGGTTASCNCTIAPGTAPEQDWGHGELCVESPCWGG